MGSCELQGSGVLKEKRELDLELTTESKETLPNPLHLPHLSFLLHLQSLRYPVVKRKNVLHLKGLQKKECHRQTPSFHLVQKRK